jgi:hypothetical protein
LVSDKVLSSPDSKSSYKDEDKKDPDSEPLVFGLFL